MERLRKRHLRFLGYKIFRFRQAQQFAVLVGLSFCYYFIYTEIFGSNFAV